MSNPATPPPRTLCEAFQRSAARAAEHVALRTVGSRVEITWAEYAARVRNVAAGMAALGIGRGDTVALMTANRPEMHIADAAAFHLGATPFSVYNTSAVQQIEYVLSDAGPRMAIVDAPFVERLFEARKSSALEHVFVVDGEVDGAHPFAELETGGDAAFDFDGAWASVQASDIAVLIYTSGTTGPPKGIELTHANLVAGWDAFKQLMPRGDMPSFISYLPVAHLADRIVAHYPAMFTAGCVTCVADSRDVIAALPDARPSMFLAVPRVWEKLKASLEAEFAADPNVQRGSPVLGQVEAGVTGVRVEMAGEPVPTDVVETRRRADAAILASLRERLGLDRAELLISGAAPIAAEVLQFFVALGLPICEGWALSEASGVCTLNPPNAIRIGTVGPAMPGVEVRLAADRELLVRGPNVMHGYRHDPEQTAEAIDSDGWLHSGDIGEIDSDGYVRIVDRKKDLIINAAGKNMSPANIESHLKASSPLIGVPVAIGDRRSYNTALIVLDPDGIETFAREHGMVGVSLAALAASEEVEQAVASGIERANQRLSRVEQIKRFTILPGVWQPGGDELTPTMKLRRTPIAEKYAAEIEAMYRG